MRRLVSWICLPGTMALVGAVLISCGSSASTSVFDSGTMVDASLGPMGDAAPPQAYDAPTLLADTGFACVPKSCADLGLTCGMNNDGCGGQVDCGTCATGEFCGGGGYSKCGTGIVGAEGGADGGAEGGSCMPLTCQAIGLNCGMNSDGCGGTIDCGACPTGQFCGGGGFARCGTGVTPDGGAACTPKTCADLNYTCGAAGDGCGGALQCGTCTPPQYCGGGGFNTCGGMLPPTLPDGGVGIACTPETCASLGFNCGPAGDGCGGTLECGTCSGTDICGGGGKPGICGNATPCTNLCTSQVSCDGGAQTTVTGTVFAGVSAWTGLAPDPVPNVLVFVPNAPLQAFTPGASCRQCGADVSGSPLVSTYTNFDGTFTLTNVPAGTTIPLVIQLGRWRRQFVFDVPACASTSVGTLNLPRNQSEGNIPLTAISTGSVDALECVLLKMGLDQAEFTADTGAGGTGRIQIYAGNPGPTGGGLPANGAPGATVPAARTELSLMGTGGTYMNYDQIMFPCWGAPAVKPPAELANLVTYSDSGGHFFATHYSYSWLVNNAEFNNVAQWVPDYDNPQDATWTLNVSTIVPPSPPAPNGETFAKWLNFVGALSNSAATVPANPQVAIAEPRHDATAVANGSVDWIDGTDQRANGAGCTECTPANFSGSGTALVEHFTFNTPVGATSQCGHDIFSDFHVLNAGSTNGQVFPAECDKAFSPQEKVLEFMIWDLASCVPPPPPPNCTPTTCSAQNISCGPAGNGCGGQIDCGPCPAGYQCGGNGVYGQCVPIPDAATCQPQTCAQQGVACGPSGDGCGASIDCGMCPPPQTCGGCGVPGQCCTTGCMPVTCAQQNIMCGPAGDGCGNLLDCGPCAAGQSCGGGGTPGQCGGCTPLSCAQLNISCGAAGDGCGNLLDCGTCPTGQTCGGGGIPGQCGGSAK
ncbi:MAG: hypothetical protein WBY94_16895 [Polyangiaceae bacterium]